VPWWTQAFPQIARERLQRSLLYTLPFTQGVALGWNSSTPSAFLSYLQDSAWKLEIVQKRVSTKVLFAASP
jgi:hypothetical protein